MLERALQELRLDGPSRLPPTTALARIAAAYAACMAYQLGAPHIPQIGTGDVAQIVSGGVGLTFVATSVALTAPLRSIGLWLFATFAAGAAVGEGLTAAGLLDPATPFKAFAVASVGFLLGTYVRFAPFAYGIAVVVLLIDIGSVAAGPTKILIETQPRAVEFLTVAIPGWGGWGGVALGVSDLLFLSAFTCFVYTFGLRRFTPVALVASFTGSLVASTLLHRAVPALPLLSLALLLPNIDTVVRQVRAGLRPDSPA